jgi:Fis family transcriptional regulator
MSIKISCEDASIPLRSHVQTALSDYFEKLDGHPTCGLYKLIITEVEKPLLEAALRHAGGNQTRAAEILGINRTTLRKKLRLYDID